MSGYLNTRQRFTNIRVAINQKDYLIFSLDLLQLRLVEILNVELTEFKLALVQLLYDKSVDVPISLLHNADQRLLIAGPNDTADDAAHRIKYRGRSLGSPDINAGLSPVIKPRAPLRQFEHRN